MLRNVMEFQNETYHGAPTALIYHDAAQTTTNSSEFNIDFDQVLYDRWGMRDNTTPFGFAVPIAGVYRGHGQISFAASAVGWRALIVRANVGGTAFNLTQFRSIATAGSFVHVSFQTPVMEPGDTVYFVGFQTSGGNLDISASTSTNMENCSAAIHWHSRQ